MPARAHEGAPTFHLAAAALEESQAHVRLGRLQPTKPVNWIALLDIYREIRWLRATARTYNRQRQIGNQEHMKNTNGLLIAVLIVVVGISSELTHGATRKLLEYGLMLPTLVLFIIPPSGAWHFLKTSRVSNASTLQLIVIRGISITAIVFVILGIGYAIIH